MTTLSSVCSLQERTPIARADLIRFDITAPVPAPLVMLIVDLFDVLPDPAATHFIDRIRSVLRADVDLSTLAPHFLLWMLTDARHGLVNLTQRDEIRAAIRIVVARILAAQANGEYIEPDQYTRALTAAEATQHSAWLRFLKATGPRLPLRVDWMVASAATDAVRRQIPSSITNAMHAGAVAWSAAAVNANKASIEFYHALSEHLIRLIVQQNHPAPARSANDSNLGITPGRRVKFFDAETGRQTGKVLAIGTMQGEPSAWILVDHALSGITWNVRLTDLQLETPEAA